jgi:adenylate cyclase
LPFAFGTDTFAAGERSRLAREQRKLAAILAVDAVGYSRLMGRDESGTLARLKAHRAERFEPALARNGGRLVKLTGDGALAEFGSAVDALRAAIEFQQAVAEANARNAEAEGIVFRVGLHLGDLIVDGDDLYGDGVNIAARLEPQAPSGGIVISGAVHEAVVGRLMVSFEDLGRLTLKNIERPVQAFGVAWDDADWLASQTSASPEQRRDSPAPPLPDRPCIAVLPFANMSSDPEQEFFADGMTEDIITQLSKLRDVLVIARNSTFTYKGKAIDVKQVGRELGVRYVLEGSIRRASNRLRVTGQLIETASGGHVWADRWDCELADIFEIQDQVTARIYNAIGGALVKEEAGRAARGGQANIQAWQLRIQAWEGFHRWDRQRCLDGVELGREAMRLDPGESDGYLATAACLYAVAASGWAVSGQEAMNEVVALLSRALNLDADNALAHSLLGLALVSFGRHDEAASQVKRGCEVAPGSYYASVSAGIVLGYCGEPHEALGRFETAFRVSPRDPRLYSAYQSQCVPLFALDRYEQVIRAAQYVMRQVPNWTESFTMQAAAYARLGQLDEARNAVESLRRIDAQYSLRRALRRHPYRDATERDKLADALGQAGLT